MALSKDRAARAIFDAFSRSHRREYVKYVADAKQPATRERRAAKAVEMMVAKASGVVGDGGSGAKRKKKNG